MRTLAALSMVIAVVACSQEDTRPTLSDASAGPSASAKPAPAPVPSASASAAPEPHHDCPAGSTGVGSFNQPCEAKGATRLMTVRWTKTDDKGPNFSIKNISQSTILYGRIAVYFYDKSGKQIEVPDTSDTAGKTKPFHTCAGAFFQGVMKPGESAVLTFSCVPKKVVPDSATTIEAEMQIVGFADPSEKKIDYYWRNAELTPNMRRKGGIK